MTTAGSTLFLAAMLAIGLLIRGRRRQGQAERAWDPAPGERNRHFWGYRDTAFEFCGERIVRLSGDRYPLAGPPLPDFMPFVEQMLGLEIDPATEITAEPAADVPPPKINEAFSAALAECIPAERRSAEGRDRLVHSHGQLSVDEVFRILNGGRPERVVDLVVYPQDADEVTELVRLADRHNVVLIPYGGGTNVSGALLCPPEEQRMIVSVDMSRMSSVLEIDRENHLATVEAGITGKELEAQLEAAGYTCGHIPDSIEFSTLGGWIATNASGMKKNRYGNIEEVVREMVLVTPAGEITSRPPTPRNSTGIQPRALLFGHEGTLGIITQAIIQVHPRPEVCRYASFLFHDFAAGLGYLRAVQDAGIRPASIRLANNTEFRLGRALGRHERGWRTLVAWARRNYVLGVRGFDPQRMVLCTIVMEGAHEEVRAQWRALARLGRACGGMAAGAEGGRRGYQTTFAIAYIRDFLNRFGILGETFETSAPWNRVEDIVAAVEDELHEQCGRHGVTGRPYLSYRVSQSYHSGVCIYFTMGFSGRGLQRPMETYQAIEHRLREVIMEQGGSLSHHHGVGKVRRDFMPQVHTAAACKALYGLKAAVDPRDVFAVRNHVFGLEDSGQGASAEGGGGAPRHGSPRA